MLSFAANFREQIYLQKVAKLISYSIFLFLAPSDKYGNNLFSIL